MSNMPKRLSDLRKTRKHITFEGVDDDEPFKIDLWVVKLNDADVIACRAAANAEKARATMEQRDETSDVWLDAYTQTLNLGDDDTAPLVEWLSQFHALDRMLIVQAEVGGTPGSEWAKEDYLEGLFDAWRGTETTPGLQLAWQARNDDPATLDPALAAQIPEAIKVFDEIERYNEACEVKLEAERQRYIREHADDSIDVLRRQVVERHLEERATRRWSDTFEKAKIFYCTRTFDDFRTRYFNSPAEVNEVDPAFQKRILDAYEEMSVDGIAGKGLPGPQSSSPESGSSDEEATSDTSGPMAATG